MRTKIIFVLIIVLALGTFFYQTVLLVFDPNVNSIDVLRQEQWKL